VDTSKRIFIAGHNGMVGSAIIRALKKRGYNNLITADRQDLDLKNQNDVNAFFTKNKIDIVYNAAAKVGGIIGNATYPADFIIDNISIQNNIISACIDNNIEKYVFLGSCCIYPKECPQPMKEEYLLTGPLELTNQPYAVAKIAGIVSCQAAYEQYGLKSVCPMPINLFGTGDNLDPDNSHIIPGLMRRLHFAKIKGLNESVVWGSGKVLREYMHVDDCADGIIFLTDKFEKGEIINVAPGTELTTRETAEVVADVVGFKGSLVQDTSKPDGTMRKYASNKIMKSLGWQPNLDFRTSLEKTYEDFKKEIKNAKWS
tara:strand:+ start:314 stop:1258 length:945 start_codon:yes stop_codon:yes gene_type:complete